MDFTKCFELGVDFMDMNNGCVIYCIQEYKKEKSKGLNPKGILVVDPMTGEVLGIVEESTLQQFISEQRRV